MSLSLKKYTSRDFTLVIYKRLLKALAENGYMFMTLEEFLLTKQSKDSKIVILRHDVDNRKLNSLEFARIQAILGIKGTYFFRIVPASYSVEIIKQIKCFGHEIGYHYEDINLALKELNLLNHSSELSRDQILDKAWELFIKHLNIFRNLYPIKTISMHGSPMSKYDNKMVWEKYDYKERGIVGEPYFDLDFNNMAYFTDTGRRWNGLKVSVRDKVNSQFIFDFRNTSQIINNIDLLPDKVMFTFHPQRWTDNSFLWLREIVIQNSKNIIKRFYASSVME